MEESYKRIQSSGNLYTIMISFMTKTYTLKMYFPTPTQPTSQEVDAAVQKVYPGGKVLAYYPCLTSANAGYIVANEQMLPPIDPAAHRKSQRIEKATKLKLGSGGAESQAADAAIKRLGGSGISLPLANSYEHEGEELEENTTIDTPEKRRRNYLINIGVIGEGKKKDHEVAMAQAQLKSAESNLKTLQKKLGKKEKDIPAWIQAKITDTDHNLGAAAQYESAAWTRKEGKNKKGGLNEKGRKSYERENPGSDLKAPSKKVGNPRRASFCARMSGMKKKLTSSKTANDPNSRINKSLRAWNC